MTVTLWMFRAASAPTLMAVVWWKRHFNTTTLIVKLDTLETSTMMYFCPENTAPMLQPPPQEQTVCTISVDGQECNACRIDNFGEITLVDCSNIQPTVFAEGEQSLFYGEGGGYFQLEYDEERCQDIFPSVAPSLYPYSEFPSLYPYSEFPSLYPPSSVPSLYPYSEAPTPLYPSEVPGLGGFAECLHDWSYGIPKDADCYAVDATI
jgi:hypothetical protein